MKITKSQLKEIIKEEVSRLQKKNILESRKKEITNELRTLNEYEDEFHSENVSGWVDMATKEFGEWLERESPIDFSTFKFDGTEIGQDVKESLIDGFRSMLGIATNGGAYKVVEVPVSQAWIDSKNLHEGGPAGDWQAAKERHKDEDEESGYVDTEGERRDISQFDGFFRDFVNENPTKSGIIAVTKRIPGDRVYGEPSYYKYDDNFNKEETFMSNDCDEDSFTYLGRHRNDTISVRFHCSEGGSEGDWRIQNIVTVN